MRQRSSNYYGILHSEIEFACRLPTLQLLATPIRAVSDRCHVLQEQQGYSKAVEDLLFDYFAQYVQQNFANEIAAYQDQVRTMDLRSPHTWYPFARALKRKIVYHAGQLLVEWCLRNGGVFRVTWSFGARPQSMRQQAVFDSCFLAPIIQFCLMQQWFCYFISLNIKSCFCDNISLHTRPGATNSGKTYTAIQRLKKAEYGIYCGPLRLLAMEVYETLNHEGVWCSLMTGQEKQVVPGATHVACTVEMAPSLKRVDVAVIDEIQCLGTQLVVCMCFHLSMDAPLWNRACPLVHLRPRGLGAFKRTPFVRH